MEGISAFDADDGLYLSEYNGRESLVPLHTTWQGTTPGFADSDWTTCDPTQLVMYLRPLGRGGVLYNTLGHCRGHYDAAPILDYWPTIRTRRLGRPRIHGIAASFHGLGRWSRRLRPEA